MFGPIDVHKPMHPSLELDTVDNLCNSPATIGLVVVTRSSSLGL
jgi:hypothetical protein